MYFYHQKTINLSENNDVCERVVDRSVESLFVEIRRTSQKWLFITLTFDKRSRLFIKLCCINNLHYPNEADADIHTVNLLYCKSLKYTCAILIGP